jgi:hypothetical protein
MAGEQSFLQELSQEIKVDLAGYKSSRWDIKCSSWDDIKSSRWDIKVPKLTNTIRAEKRLFRSELTGLSH